MALYVTPWCPTLVSQGCTKGIDCTGLQKDHSPSISPSLLCCAVSPWPGSETQRGRCYGVRAIESLPPANWSYRPHSWGEAESRTPSVSMGWDVLEPECFSNSAFVSRFPFGSVCRLVSQSHEGLLTASFPLWGRYVASLFLRLHSEAGFSLWLILLTMNRNLLTTWC